MLNKIPLSNLMIIICIKHRFNYMNLKNIDIITSIDQDTESPIRFFIKFKHF